MKKEELASILNGREYTEEITNEESQTAKENNLVVVFGYSDDIMAFEGAINDEAYDLVKISKNRILERPSIEYYDTECDNSMNEYDQQFEKYLQEKKEGNYIEPIWNEENKFVWSYKTDIPHATFEIFDQKQPFCKGIVFSLDELKQPITV